MLYEVKYLLTTTSAQTGIKTKQTFTSFVESNNLQTLRVDFYASFLRYYAKAGFNIYNVSYQKATQYESFIFNFELYGSHAMGEITDIITTVK